MLKVNINRNRDRQIHHFEAFGHCGFDERGKDLVCASASILLQVAVLGINDYCRVEPIWEISEGYLSCNLPDIKNQETMRDIQTILETMLIGLKKIQSDYPQNIEIIDSGVSICPRN